ncbi:hypothetical protein BJX64DRAFT_252236 [Aspergillus heterothallicus]
MANVNLQDMAVKCQTAIENLVIVAYGGGNHAEATPDHREIGQLRDRYDQWACNLGALQPSSSPLSLEHRLQNSPIVSNIVAAKLLDLHISLQAVTEIAEGKRPNRQADFFSIDPGFDLNDYDVSSSDSDSVSITGMENLSRSKTSTTEVEELVSAIKISIDSLFRVSIFIRKFAPKDKRQRSSQTKPFDNRADILRVKDRYPVMDKKNEGLAERLGEANARRRQYFKYRSDHYERLSNVNSGNSITSTPTFEGHPHLNGERLRVTGSVVTDLTKPTLLATSEATAFLAKAASDVDVEKLLNPEPAMSCISFATSIGEPDEELPFPALPEGYSEGAFFLCPYCSRVIQVKRGNLEYQWRKHIIEDLEPYVCTFSTCGLETYHSEDAWFQHELLVHRSRYECQRCSTSFETSRQLKQHFSRHDMSTMTAGQISTLLEQSKRPVDWIGATECPFCDEPWAKSLSDGIQDEAMIVVTPQQFKKHVGQHMRQTAIFTLPRLLQNPGENSVAPHIAFENSHFSAGVSTSSSKPQAKVMQFPSPVNAVACSPDGQTIVSAFGSSLRVWDADTGLSGRTLEGHTRSVRAVAFLSGGQTIVSGSEDSTIRLWDTTTGLTHHILAGHSGPVFALTTLLSSGVLISGSNDNTIKIWDVTTGLLKQELEGHAASVLAIACSPDEQTIVSGSADRTLRLWDAIAGRERQLLQLDSTLNPDDDTTEDLDANSGFVPQTVRPQTPPSRRDEYAIAIICSTSLEVKATKELFDETYDRSGRNYGSLPGDENSYIHGRIGNHNVVLCYLAAIGTVSAVRAAACMRASYPSIELALVVGICGGAPYSFSGEEIFLGDVIISDCAVQYGFGRQYPDGFKNKIGVMDTLGRPKEAIRAILASLLTRQVHKDLQDKFLRQLQALQESQPDWHRPSSADDILFEASYQHKHHGPITTTCLCLDNVPHTVCNAALSTNCAQLGCDKKRVYRCRHGIENCSPTIHIGKIASGDTVLKSGEIRDYLVQSEGVIGFDMEGAGFWGTVPCIIIKGVCDYADSHKSKAWQAYAAQTGAAAAKAFMEYWVPTARKKPRYHLSRDIIQ